MFKDKKNRGQDEDSIEKLKTNLNARGFKTSLPRGALREEHQEVSTSWEGSEIGEHKMSKNKKKNTGASFLPLKIFIVALVFFVVAVTVALMVFFSNSNIVSSSNVEIEITGPIAISGGDEAVFQVLIMNKNNVDLQLADLIVEFPKGSYSTEDLSTELIRTRKSVGKIKSGEFVNETIKAVIFGQEDAEKNIKVSLEYRLEGSNAIFVKESEYKIQIGSAPFNLTFDFADEINSNQKMGMTVTISSNSSTIAEDVALLVNYPFGFVFSNGDPEPTLGNNLWRLGDLQPGGKRTISIQGVVKGQDEEEKVFSAHIGQQKENDERGLAVIYGSASKSAVIKRPFIGVDLTINGSSSEEIYVGEGEIVRADLSWVNNLPNKIINASLEVQIEGMSIDESSVFADRGVYNSLQNTIFWDKRSYSDLDILESGERGRMSFGFRTSAITSSGLIENPVIRISVSAQGKEVGENVVNEITEFISKTIKLSSRLQLISKATYFTGPFVNNGALPPVAESETTYTITLNVINSTNSASDVKVSAVLPSYVRLIGSTSPLGENISYNNSSGELIWNIGDLDAGIGISKPIKEVSFQISLLPSLNQVGTIPVLVSNIKLSGYDDFTGKSLSDEGNNINTRFSSDPQFTSIYANVVAP